MIQMDSFKSTSLVTLLANAVFSIGFSEEELALLAALLTQLGDTLSTIAACNSIASRVS